MKKIILAALISSMSFSITVSQSNQDLLDELMDMSGSSEMENINLNDLDELEELNELLNQQRSSSTQQRQPQQPSNTNEIDELEEIQQRSQARSQNQQRNIDSEEEGESASTVFSNQLPDDALGDLEDFRQTMSSNNNSTFLKFVPVDTNVVFNQSLIIPPTREYYVYSFGRSLLPEDIDRENYSVCYIQFRPSNRARSLQRNRAFPIVQNNTQKINVTSEPNKPVYVSTFRVDTPHIERLKCMTNQKDEPLTINDFNQHFSGFVSLRFPSYEEI